MPNKLFLEGAANLSDQLDRMNLNEEYSNQGISSVGRREQLSVWDRPSHNLNDGMLFLSFRRRGRFLQEIADLSLKCSTETSTHNLITHLELMEKFRNPSRFSENSSQYVIPHPWSKALSFSSISLLHVLLLFNNFHFCQSVT